MIGVNMSDGETLVERIDIHEVKPCTADPNRIKFIARANNRLNVVLPILYLYLPNSRFSEELGTLTFTYEQHNISLFASGKIGMTYVKDLEEARKLVEFVKNLVNRAYKYFLRFGRPSNELFELKKKVTPLNIYNFLPHSECKRECGEVSCFSFAVKLLSGGKTLRGCTLYNWININLEWIKLKGL